MSPCLDWGHRGERRDKSRGRDRSSGAYVIASFTEVQDFSVWGLKFKVTSSVI